MFREDEGAVRQGDKRSGDIPLIREHHINPWGLEHPEKGGIEEWISRKSPRVKTIGEFVAISRRGAKGDRRRLTAWYVSERHCGIENKVVYLRSEDSGKESLMKGVSAFLNTMFAEIQIRTIVGGTMVNKSDLVRLRIPSKKLLTSVGEGMQPDNPEDSRGLQELFSEQLGLSNSDTEEWIEHLTRWRGNR